MNYQLDTAHEISILYHDTYYIIVDKPAGISVHAENKYESRTNQNLLRLTRNLVGHYLFPIHRLDRPASGVVIFALSAEAARQLKDSWHSSTEKHYFTLCRRQLTSAGEFSFPLKKGEYFQEALTKYKPLEVFPEFTLCDVEIKTGRYHQIRRHFARRMHAIVGDRQHGKSPENNYFRDKLNFNRLFLHAHELSFHHPFTHQRIVIKSELPKKCQEVLSHLRTRSASAERILHQPSRAYHNSQAQPLPLI